MEEIWESVKTHNILGTKSKNDRYATRKFSSSIATIKKSFSEFSDLVDSSTCYGLLDKVVESNRLCEKAGSKFNRYENTLKKDVFYLSTMLGVNEEVNLGKQKYFAVYDLGKYHHIALSALLGVSPRKAKAGIVSYLDRIGITFSKYLNYLMDGVKSDVIEHGFNIAEFVSEISNSYLNLKRLADMMELTVTEFIRLYVIKFNEITFNNFMSELEDSLDDSQKILVQSVGLDTLMISGMERDVFKDLELSNGVVRWYLSPEIFRCTEFNSEIPKYYLDRKLVA